MNASRCDTWKFSIVWTFSPYKTEKGGLMWTLLMIDLVTLLRNYVFLPHMLSNSFLKHYLTSLLSLSAFAFLR